MDTVRIGNIWRLWADIKKEEGIGEESEKEGVIGRRDNNDREEQNFFKHRHKKRKRQDKGKGRRKNSRGIREVIQAEKTKGRRRVEVNFLECSRIK